MVKIWEMSDITKGDVKAQQGIRFNIFQLNQTYLGKDSRLNIDQKDLPVKSTEDLLIGILRPIVFLLYG
jgi:trehalose/maltose hydrolase-like predicted phosphorylase